jgi:hypothetical protein
MPRTKLDQRQKLILLLLWKLQLLVAMRERRCDVCGRQATVIAVGDADRADLNRCLQHATTGRPKPRPAHSRISPSQSALVWHCQGSVQAQDAAGRPEAGEAALRGTALHALAEAALRQRTPLPADAAPEVVAYVAEIRRLTALHGVTPWLEHKLDLSAYHPELYGTLDAASIDHWQHVLTIIDFKSGVHPVAADALQLKLYGGMLYVTLGEGMRRGIRSIDTVVVQPNGEGEPIRSTRHRIADIINTLSDYVERAHVATDAADPPRSAGPWCREQFCAARKDCPAFHAMAGRAAQREFTAATEGEPGTD